MYLVGFTYDYYCQGWDETTTSVLVHGARSFKGACDRILESKKYRNARYFVDQTIL